MEKTKSADIHALMHAFVWNAGCKTNGSLFEAKRSHTIRPTHTHSPPLSAAQRKPGGILQAWSPAGSTDRTRRCRSTQSPPPGCGLLSGPTDRPACPGPDCSTEEETGSFLYSSVCSEKLNQVRSFVSDPDLMRASLDCSVLSQITEFPECPSTVFSALLLFRFQMWMAPFPDLQNHTGCFLGAV